MTITRRKDGRWVGTVTVGGKQRHVYGRTRKEVNEKLAQLDQDPTEMTVGSFLATWLAKMRSGWEDKTYSSYESELRVHIIPHVGHIPLADLSVEDVHRLIERLQQDGRAGRSVYYSMAVFSRALNWAVNWRHVRENVVRLVKLPRYSYRQITPLTVEQARDFLKAVEGHRLEALYRLALSLGLRQGELFKLRWGDVDLERRLLFVRKSKTPAGRRALELPAPLIYSLLSHRERVQGEGLYAPDGRVFPSTAGTEIKGRNIHRHFKRALKRAGLPNVRFHDLRHSCAAFLIAQGVNLHVVKEILGHSKISVTSDTYGHLLPGVGGAAIEGVVRGLDGEE